MSTNKQALREAAEKAIGAHERLSVMPSDDIFDISLAEGTQLDADVTAMNAFNDAAKPATVLALLDELEAAQKSNEFLKEQLAQLASFNPDWDKLEAAEKRIAELEARTPYGYLRQCDGQIQISIGREQPHNRSGGYATPWFAIYTAAGIGVKGE